MNRILLFLYLIFHFYGSSQKEFLRNSYLSLGSQVGYQLPEYSFINTIAKSPTYGVELSLVKRTYGANEWEQWFNYPEYGFSLFHSSLGNNEAFGRETALNYSFKLFLTKKHKLRPFQQIAVGLNYVSRKFDAATNYFNVAVGSHVNIYFNLRMGINYEFSPKWNANLGLAFNHFSNANSHEPNLGLNYVSGYLSVSKNLGMISDRILTEKTKHDPSNSIKAWVGLGGKRTRLLSTNYYLTSSFSMDFERRFSRKFSIGVGPDFFYDSSIKSSFAALKKDFQTQDALQTGVHFSFSVIYNRLSLHLQEGMYLGLMESVDGFKFYNRGIVQFQVAPKWSVRITMKSHLQILDFPEFGLGFKL